MMGLVILNCYVGLVILNCYMSLISLLLIQMVFTSLYILAFALENWVGVGPVSLVLYSLWFLTK